ncbi:hypothetical protein SEA_BACHOME_90 [Mycobacterium phage Bachome]|nr:hypothetical protein SEA_EBONY_91 [Mycobacterium phage Ebony]AXC33548.1 hypothetical protein SEA_JOSELITO_90 [Mycobacterium phage Joselito]QBI97916.1 hypothetical protein SEA_ORANGE_92 [Mycobacterium phage Orange]QBI98254.1 hypothetical protein SEA_BOWTIE_88 [Mycobacterium phage Bowtie]QBI98460.1 hypothetical protein SEA_MUNCH_91 [Mycobacterium phage Munch]QBI98545.1 hypothetical protein SEA_BUD_85 [Mycobacterium phage Bud]QGJ91382.1 hypothetical protein SEA_BACHOME_90 [Mycobacterium phage
MKVRNTGDTPAAELRPGDLVIRDNVVFEVKHVEYVPVAEKVRVDAEFTTVLATYSHQMDLSAHERLTRLELEV